MEKTYIDLPSEAIDFWALKAVPVGKRLDLEELDLEQRHIVILLDYLSKGHLSKDDIDAASHIDILSKLVTCTQAGWTGIQIIARLVEGLDVSLIEVITAGFILTAIISYWNWLKKPYNIGQSKEVKLPYVLNFGDGQTLSKSTLEVHVSMPNETSEQRSMEKSEEESQESLENKSSKHSTDQPRDGEFPFVWSGRNRTLGNDSDHQLDEPLNKRDSGKSDIIRTKSDLKQGLQDTKRKAILSYKG